ncbi:MAG: ATP-binding protein [Dehalococcoidia bacterium]|jgi:ATP-dependent DNA helicase RecG
MPQSSQPVTLVGLDRVEELIAQGETLHCEFKSDKRRLSDDELVEAVVCLANTEGGVVLLGVEDDGTPTGINPKRKETTDAIGAMIFNKTEPHTHVRASWVSAANQLLLRVEVKPSTSITATAQGKCVRRVYGVQGPECVPFPPSEHASRRGDLRQLDYSAAQLEECGMECVDPVALAKLRALLRASAPDLAELGDADLLAALSLSSWIDKDNACLTVAALLCVGTADAIARWLPTHEVAFQVFGEDETVTVNEFSADALLSMLDEIELRFDAINKEVELEVGLARVGIRDYPKAAFREGLLNALVHRDYAKKGTVYIQVFGDRLQISNPGGFPAGVTLENLLVHEPVPRNPRLANTFLRLGLVERSGRGIDRIFSQQLRWGRPAPSYAQSTPDTVRLTLSGGAPSLKFVALALQEEAGGRQLQLVDLLVLSHLEREHQISLDEVQRLTQTGLPAAKRTIERLVERGLVAPARRRSNFQLGSAAHKMLGTTTEFVRAKGFEPIQQAAMVESFVASNGRIVRAEVIELCRIDGDHAKMLLRQLVKDGRLSMEGHRRSAFYVKGPRFGITQK